MSTTWQDHGVHCLQCGPTSVNAVTTDNDGIQNNTQLLADKPSALPAHHHHFYN